MKRIYTYDKGLVVILILVVLGLGINFPEAIEYTDPLIPYRDSVAHDDSIRSIRIQTLTRDSFYRAITPQNDSEYWTQRNILIDTFPPLTELLNGGVDGNLWITEIDSVNVDVNFWTFSIGGRLWVDYINYFTPDSAGGLYSMEWCTFPDGADIRTSYFKDIQLMQSDFNHTVFDGVHCRGDAYFEMNNFTGPFIISRSEFNKTVTFFECTFDEVRIDETKIKGKLIFDRCIFNGPVSFNKNDSIDVIEFVNCELPSIISFRGEQDAYFKEENQIQQILFSENNNIDSAHLEYCYLDFPLNYASRVGEVNIDYMKYRLWFPPELSYENRSLYYLTLLKHFQDVGYTDSYEELDKEYQRVKYLHSGLGFIDLFNRIWWDYGYNKLKVILNSLMLWFLFCCVNVLLFNYLNRNVYPVRFQPLKEPDAQLFRKSPWHMKAILSLEYALNRFGNSVMYTSALFFGLKLELDRFKSNNSLKLYILLMYCLGLFCVAYIVNIIIVR